MACRRTGFGTVLVRGVAAALAVLTLAACGQSVGVAVGSVPAVKTSPSPEPTVRVPITKAVAAADFAGDDAEFLKRVRHALERGRVATDWTDATLRKLGREFCSVISGGGNLPDKVDFWAGLRKVGNDVDVAIFYAARDTYCPDLWDGYVRLRLAEPKLTVTPEEQADLARYAVRLPVPDAARAMAALSDATLRKRADVLCGMTFEPGWNERSATGRLLAKVPDEAEAVYLLGLSLAYCPGKSDAVLAALRPFVDGEAGTIRT